jgi:sulfite exporter TauE/SafE
MLTALLTGMLIGFIGSTHCIVMCGGIAGALSVALPPARRTPLALGGRQLCFSVGRICSYVLAGATAGAVGGLVSGLIGAYGVLSLRLCAGVLLIAAGLYVLGWVKPVAALEQQGAKLWRKLAPLSRYFARRHSTAGALALGALWGWMPCGMVYSALAMASASGGSASGAAFMLGFGSGTVPALIGLGALAQQSMTQFGRSVWSRRLAGALMIAFAGASVAINVSPIFRSPISHDAIPACAHTAPPGSPLGATDTDGLMVTPRQSPLMGQTVWSEALYTNGP